MSKSAYQASQTDPTIPYIDDEVKESTSDKKYSTSVLGKLKILEIIFSLLVFICATVAVRNYAVFYGCAVWGSVVGFLCMVIAAALLVIHLYKLPIVSPILELLYCAAAAISFLIAGVMLILVADAAMTIPRVHFFRSSLTHDRLTIHDVEMLGRKGVLDGVDWLVQTTPANAHEFRAAVCGAVFSFAAAMIHALDAYLHNNRLRRSAQLKRKPAALA